MNLLPTDLRSYLLTGIFIALVLMSACGPAARRPEPDDLVWPLPPNPPKIKYIQSIYTEDDIGRAYSFMDSFGKEYGCARPPVRRYARRGRIYVTDLTMRGIGF
jgi:hypothetical protein